MDKQKTQQITEYTTRPHERGAIKTAQLIEATECATETHILSRLSRTASRPPVPGKGLSHPNAAAHQAALMRTLQRRQGNAFVQRAVMQGRSAAAIPDHAVQQAQSDGSSGQSLDTSVQADMETSFGQDFSGVRVHTDGKANDLAQGIHAQAFTRGQDIYFGAGRYQPGTAQGKHLLAHELTHTIQQRQEQLPATGIVQSSQNISQPGDPLEIEAETVAYHVMRGDTVTSARASSTSERTLQRVSLGDIWEGTKSAASTVGEAISSAGEGVWEGAKNLASTSTKGSWFGGGGADSGFVGGGGTSGGGGASGSFDEETPAPRAKPLASSTPSAGGSSATPATPPSSGGLSISFLPDIVLFDEINYNKELFSKDTGEVPFVDEVVDIPYVGPVSLVAFTRGIATSQLFATVGPGVLQKITITINPFASRYTGSAELFIPFGGGAGLTLNGSIGGRADYLGLVNVAALRGGLNADGAAKLVGDVTVTPEIIYDKGDITFTTQAQLDTCLQFIFKLDAFLEGSLLSGLTSRLKFRKNWSLVDWMWQYCYQLGASLSISYIKGRPSVSLDFTGKPISFKTMIHDLLEHAPASSTITPPPTVPPSPVGPGPSPVLPGANGPTGLDPSDPISMRWFKHPTYYPSPIDIGGFLYERDNPTTLPHGEPIGVPDEYWPYISKTMQQLPSRRGPNAGRFRTVLEGYGFSWVGLDADHVQDIQWDGPDLFENLWPMDSSANRSAGPRQNIFQLVVFSEKPGDPARTTRIDDPALTGRWFEIIAVDY